MFVSAGVGFCALAAVIRGLRGDAHMGNFYLDMWRVVVYVFLPVQPDHGRAADRRGRADDVRGRPKATRRTGSMGTDDAAAKPQVIARGPVAAILPIKHLGTNGGGFFGANSAHPFENPTAWTNFLDCVNILIFPFSLVVMFGRMLEQHAACRRHLRRDDGACSSA